MFKENFPIIDPLASGHAAAEKILKKKEQQEFEAKVDEAILAEKDAKEAEELDREEIYEKDPEEGWWQK